MLPAEQIKVKSIDGNIQAVGVTSKKQLSSVMFGVDDEDVIDMLLTQIKQSIPSIYNQDDAGNYAMAILLDIKPRDGMEAMLITQMVVVQSQSMEYMRRAVLPEQSEEGVDINITLATKLQRTFVQQMEALQKYRNKGKQTIQVQHVNVEAGGQAVVGNIGGRANG